MARKYKLNPINLNYHHETMLSIAKTEYIRRYPNNIRSEKNPFDFCIIYFVINPDRTLKLDFKYPQEIHLLMNVVAKKPKGLTPGSAVCNIDIREITKIIIPPYNGKFFFDFIIWVLDITTDNYWMSHLL